jgi:serine/threonine-protein kinase
VTEAPRIGKYTIVGTLGRGGMGVVYKGYDPVIKRNVALKLLHKADLARAELPVILERFKREAQAVGSLQHPNIVAIYEYGEDAEHAFIAMECVEGRSLREHLVAGWRPELRECPEVLTQLFEGLDYSHSRGVIHRDIKPANVLISESGVVKISDFGIARLERSHVEASNEIVGTPFYMSPEQYQGRPVDERTDIYSAAVIVYEVLTGRRPFTGSASTLMRQVLEDTPIPPSELEPRLPAEIDEVVLKGLAKSPADRYRTVRELAEALQHVFYLHPSAPAAAPRAGEDTTQPRKPQVPRQIANASLLRRVIGVVKSDAEPVAASSDAQSVAPSTAADALPVSRRPCVLFVDDEARILNSLRSIFRNTYDVLTAASGEEALQILQTRHVHLVVSDQRMPGMLGVELLRKARGLAPSTVRILLTGYSDLVAIVGSVNDGEVYRFINKPWNQNDLMTTVGEAVSIALALQNLPVREQGNIDPRLATLVLGDGSMFRAVRELVGGIGQVLEAPTLDDALRLFGEHEVAVVVADLEAEQMDNAVLFKILKEEHPETLVIVTTGASDSDLIISLINEARIFRFVNKPVNLTILQQHIVAALERYQAFRSTPQLVQTQRARVSQAAHSSSLGQSILGRLKSISGRIRSALGS